MTDDNIFLSQNSIFQSTLVRTNGVPDTATIDQLSGQQLDQVSGFKTEAQPWYSDQILPFDITLAGTNENGAATCMKIFGVEILNEGSGVSIDDAVTEMQATFVARCVEPLGGRGVWSWHRISCHCWGGVKQGFLPSVSSRVLLPR